MPTGYTWRRVMGSVGSERMAMWLPCCALLWRVGRGGKADRGAGRRHFGIAALTRAGFFEAGGGMRPCFASKRRTPADLRQTSAGIAGESRGNLAASRAETWLETEDGGRIRERNYPFHPTCRRGLRNGRLGDRKSTRLNSSHSQISYSVFCFKNKESADMAFINDGPMPTASDFYADTSVR